MTDKTTLGDRMKGYESVFKQALPGRLPIIIRVDGKAFHTYTKGIHKDESEACYWNLIEVMNLTAIKLCEEIQGAQMAYVQSDEISILVHPYKKLTSQGWFNSKLQKMVSISAAIASTTFTMESWRIWGDGKCLVKDIKPALFDSRAFVLPESEVCNYFIWRQQDATRNSIQMLARALYSHKECHNKNSSQLQEMTFEKGRNWNDEPTTFKRGRCIIKMPYGFVTPKGEKVTRMSWAVDDEIPVFTQNREYVNSHLKVEE